MNDFDKKRFMAALNGLGVAFKSPVSNDQLRLYWPLFNEFSIDEFEQACFQFLRKGKFFPAPAELFDLMPSSKAKVHVSADEAWAIVIDSMDEYSTVVMTKEIAEARGIAYDVYANGDKIGARMAFKDAYNRIIATATPPTWFVSRGFDKSRVQSAVQKAIQLGRLTEQDAAKYIEHKPQTTYKALVDESAKREPTQREPIGLRLERMAEEEFNLGIKHREMDRQAFEEKRKDALDKIASIQKSMEIGDDDE